MTNKLYSPLLIHSVKATQDLAANRFVGFDGNYCAIGVKALGVVDVATEKSQMAPINISGILLVEAGADITAGDEITSDENGKAITVARTEQVNGYSLDTAQAGELIRIVRGI